MGLRERLAGFLFGDVIDARVKAATAAISVRVDDSPGWDSLQPGPADLPWSERASALDKVLVAWRKSFMVRRLVTLTRSYVVGGGITLTSKLPEVEEFLRAFWKHPKNHMATRLGPMCDELTRAGELFPALFTNRADGMSYVRFVPASRIREIETDENDYEVELRYGQLQRSTTGLKWWIGPGHKHAFKRARGGRGGHFEPLMLHFAVNRPIGATRGGGDLGTVLPWALRYAEWLKDRVRLNRRRSRQGILDVELEDDTAVAGKAQKLRTSNPLEAGVYVHGKGEKVTMPSLEIRAGDVTDDGRALRLAIATGGNVGLHYLGEGAAVNYATAKEMGEPTARFYTERQGDLSGFLVDMTTAAYRRKTVLGLAHWPDGGDLLISANAAEVARADNESLALAAQAIVEALATMRNYGWIDDVMAATLALKFAGEAMGRDVVLDMLDRAREDRRSGDGGLAD